MSIHQNLNKARLQSAYIGDIVTIRGSAYRVMGNYPKHGYLLAQEVGPNKQSAQKIYYTDALPTFGKEPRIIDTTD